MADLPPPPHSGDSFWRFGDPICRLSTWEGGGESWVVLSWASPKHKEYSFLPRSPYLHDILLMFLMLYSPLDAALLLMLFQPSGYFLLSSSKSSFRGTGTLETIDRLNTECRSLLSMTREQTTMRSERRPRPSCTSSRRRCWHGSKRKRLLQRSYLRIGLRAVREGAVGCPGQDSGA